VVDAAATHPEIRLLKLPRIADPEVSPEIDARWAVCSPESVSDFSAVAYHFGVRLQKELGGVAIGLIDIARGGTIVETWVPRESLLADEEMRPIVQVYEESLSRFDEALARHEEALNIWRQTMPPPDPGNSGFAAGWASAELDDSAWPFMTIPCWWHRGNNDFSGVLWFRKEIELPAEFAGRDLTLSLGSCDKSDNTYFNNIEVGGIPPHVEDSWQERHRRARFLKHQ
jgi:sialate O-acetylesterase